VYDEGKFARAAFMTAKEIRKAVSEIKIVSTRNNRDIMVELSKIFKIYGGIEENTEGN